MKALASYLQERDKRSGTVKFIGMLISGVLSSITLSIFVGALYVLEISLNEEERNLVTLGWIGFSILGFYSSYVGRFLWKAIRFRQAFGTWPASTAEGREIMQGLVSARIRKLGEPLAQLYEEEEKVLTRLKLTEYVKPESFSLESVIRLEADTRTTRARLRKEIKKAKRAFYLARDRAKAVGLKVPESFKECQAANA